MARNFSRLIKSYRVFVEKSGYKIIYNGCEDTSSAVFFVMELPNEDNPKENKYVFYEIFDSAPLSVEGFEKTIIQERDIETFTKMMEARIKGCTITKTDLIFGLLESGKYTIDEIYETGQLKLTPKALKLVSHWVNFKGGRNATFISQEDLRKRREEIRARIERENRTNQ